MGRRDLFALFYRRKWVVIVTFALSLGIHCGIVYFRPAMFEVSCHAELRNPEPSNYGLQELPGAATLATARGDLVQAVIRSDEFGEIVQKDLDEHFVHLGRAWSPANLSLRTDPNSGALLLHYESSFESTQPVLIAAKRAIDEILQRSFAINIVAVRSSLNSRVVAERSALEERQQQLVDALAEVGLPSTLDPEKRYVELTEALTELEGERAAVQVELTQLQEALDEIEPESERPELTELEGSAAFATIQGLAESLIEKEIEVLRLKSTLTDAHPAVKAASLQLDQERRVYHAAFEEGSPFYPEIAAALARKRSRIDSEQLRLATRIASLETRRAEYDRWDREYRGTLAKIEQHGDSLRTLAIQRNATQQSLDELSDSLRRLSTFEKVEAPELGLLSEPSPPHRTTARLREMLGVAVLLAMVFSFGVGYVMESVDHRIHDIHVLKRLTEVPLLGAVPTAVSSASIIPAPGESPSHPEAFNSILQKLLANLEHDHRVIVISGPDVNAGKSYVSANLAIAAGRLGLRTLLVDADLRQPRMYNTFGISRFPGLSGWLDGTERGHRESLFRTVELAADGRTSLRVRPESVPRLHSTGVGLLVPANADAGCVIQQSGHTTLSLITSGREVPNPGLLLQSDRMAEFVRWARGSFDLCFIDSPPLRQVADTLLVAAHADASILVTRAGHTSGQDLKWACDSLWEVDSRIAGTILNGVLAPSGKQY